jgi:putative ABC transport system substrate-binding protein
MWVVLAGLLSGVAQDAMAMTVDEPPALREVQTAKVDFAPRRMTLDADMNLVYLAPGVDADALRKQGAAAAASGEIAVLYPDIAEPYRAVFMKIVAGIEESARSKVHTVAVAAAVDGAELNRQMRSRNVKVVIALGRQGLKAAEGLERDISVVVGGVLLLPDAQQKSLQGISLTPDPALLFARLKSLQPAVRRVLVVYDPQHNDWLIRLAREAAKAQGLELLAMDARDMGQAARLYESLFNAADGRRDALWLPQDPTTVDENTILPLVLKESWNRNIAVFSSSYLHVKKGALFVLYPNNLELGRNLAASAQRILSGEGRKGMLPLREVFSAVNLRTANHIGLNISNEQQLSFDSVFPEK